MTKKTKILIGVTAIAAVGLIVALKYFRGRRRSSSTELPVSSSTGGASGEVPLSTNIAITEAAYNQDPSEMGPAIDDPNALDEGVLTLQ